MEDSEKRKQMLKAMRMEAAAAAENDGSTNLETSTNTSNLSNPLAEETSSHHQESHETQRFDYYTDPMAAYSSFKRYKQQHISSPSLPESTGSDYQPYTNHGGFQAAHYGGDNRLTEPRGMAPPRGWNNNFRPPPVNQWVPRPYPYSQERPDIGNNRFGGRGGYNNNSQQYSHYGRQNSNWVGNSYPNQGRGRSRGRGNSSFGRDGGRGPMELGAERFYSNSMVEDPWKYLKPVLWKSCSDASSSSQTWLPNSIAPKKPTIAEASRKPNNSNQQSLAEYLAASLDAATTDEPSN